MTFNLVFLTSLRIILYSIHLLLLLVFRLLLSVLAVLLLGGGGCLGRSRCTRILGRFVLGRGGLSLNGGL